MNRVVYLSGSKIPSDEANSVHVMKMCNSFAKLGWDTTLCAREVERASLESIYSKYSIQNEFNIVRKKWPSIRFLGGFLYGLSVARWVRKNNSLNLLFARDIFSLFFLKNLGVPYIFEVHSVPATTFHKYLHRKIITNENCQFVVSISKGLKHDYLETFPELSSNKVVIAHDGADIPSETCEVPNDADKTIGYVGHLYRGRGIEVLIELAKRLPDMKFVVIGGSREDVNYWKKKAEAKNIKFYGHVNHGELNSLYPLFNIALAPYQKKVSIQGKGDTSRWMSPLKIFEYFSHKKAVVSSDISVLKEVLRNHENSILVEAEDIDMWEKAVRDLVSNPDKAANISKVAFDEFCSTYTWEKRVQRLINLTNVSRIEK